MFAALGDETRLSVLGKLCGGKPQSISRLTAGTRLVAASGDEASSRPGNAGVVRSVARRARKLFELEPEPIEAVRDYLDQVSKQWDDALARLKSHVED